MAPRFAEVTVKQFLTVFEGSHSDLQPLDKDKELVLNEKIPSLTRLHELQTAPTEKSVYNLLVRTPFHVK